MTGSNCAYKVVGVGGGGGGGGLLIFGEGNAKDMQSLQILDFERFGYKNTEKLYFLVIPWWKELSWSPKLDLWKGISKAFWIRDGGNNLNAKFSKIPDRTDPGVYVDRYVSVLVKPALLYAPKSPK